MENPAVDYNSCCCRNIIYILIILETTNKLKDKKKYVNKMKKIIMKLQNL